jgi:hypothetical protein
MRHSADQPCDVIDSVEQSASCAIKNLKKGSRETRMQDIPTDTKKRAPSSRVLQEVIRRAPPEYVTVGWLTSTLPHSFGIIMLCLGLLATTPVGSTVPGIILAIMAVQLIVGRAEPVFPHFIMTRRLPTRQLLLLGGRDPRNYATAAIELIPLRQRSCIAPTCVERPGRTHAGIALA